MSQLVNVIVSISSDIGISLAKSWDPSTTKIIGTYRNSSSALVELEKSHDVQLTPLDFSSTNFGEADLDSFAQIVPFWDNLIFATGSQEPLGDFIDLDFDAWQKGFEVNSLNQLRILHKLLPKRKIGSIPSRYPSVLFFAGGGTNGSVTHYSAYTLAKIALIKMCEILDSELKDTKFSIVGPGWVKTKIHLPTLNDLGKKSKENHMKTKEMLEGDLCTPIEDVVNSCNWILNTNSRLVSGRNFSSLNDFWGSDLLLKVLEQQPSMYKLRRYRNDWLQKRS